jgi:hypothetical protein
MAVAFSWSQIPSKFSRANVAAEAVKQIQKEKENRGQRGQRVVPLQKPRSATWGTELPVAMGGSTGMKMH